MCNGETSVNSGISVNCDLLYENSQKLVQVIAARWRRSANFQRNSKIFNRDMTLSNSDFMKDYLWRHESVNRANVVSKLIQIWKFINFWKKFREIIFANRHLLGSKQEFNFANLTKLSSRENFFPQGNIFGLSRFASTARKSYTCKDKTISTFQKSAYPTFQLNKVIIERWKTWTY